MTASARGIGSPIDTGHAGAAACCACCSETDSDDGADVAAALKRRRARARARRQRARTSSGCCSCCGGGEGGRRRACSGPMLVALVAGMLFGALYSLGVFSPRPIDSETSIEQLLALTNKDVSRANMTQYCLRTLPALQREATGWFGRARRISVELQASETAARTSSSSSSSSPTRGWRPTEFRSVVLSHATLPSCTLLGSEREHFFYVAPRASNVEATNGSRADVGLEKGRGRAQATLKPHAGTLRSEHVWPVQRPSVLCASGLFSRAAGAVDERAALNLLIAVRTRPSHLASRMAIRQTWGAAAGETHELRMGAKGRAHVNASAGTGTGVHYRYTLVFYTGRTRDERNEGLRRLERHMALEAQVYGDLLELSVVDAPANDSVATVGMMHHLASLSSKCRGGVALHQWERLLVLFTRDDAFVNVQLLVQQLLHRELLQQPSTNSTGSTGSTGSTATESATASTRPSPIAPPPPHFVAGLVLSNVAPVRQQSNPWVTPREEFTRPLFPEFVAGCAFLVNVRSARRLARHACDQPLLAWHDVLLTGIVRERLDIQLHSVHELLLADKLLRSSSLGAAEKAAAAAESSNQRPFLWSCLQVFPIIASYYEGVVISNFLSPRELRGIWKLVSHE